jgi:hypothetical protein
VAEAFSVEGPVQAEVFVVWLSDRGIELTGPCGPDPWLIEVDEGGDPVEVVGRLVRANLGDARIVHSTSWRAARDGIVLSFVVVVTPDVAASFGSIPLHRADLARSEATAAPRTILWEQVIEHGLRHLAWLIEDDNVVRRELGDEWAVALRGYVPAPFQNLR